MHLISLRMYLSFTLVPGIEYYVATELRVSSYYHCGLIDRLAPWSTQTVSILIIHIYSQSDELIDAQYANLHLIAKNKSAFRFS
jgi:hypothetical protein